MRLVVYNHQNLKQQHQLGSGGNQGYNTQVIIYKLPVHTTGYSKLLTPATAPKNSLIFASAKIASLKEKQKEKGTEKAQSQQCMKHNPNCVVSGIVSYTHQQMLDKSLRNPFPTSTMNV